MMLYCNERMTLIKVKPEMEHMSSAQKLLKEVEESDIIHSLTGETEYYKTRSEMCFREGDFKEAHYYAKASYERALSVKYHSEANIYKIRLVWHIIQGFFSYEIWHVGVIIHKKLDEHCIQSYVLEKKFYFKMLVRVIRKPLAKQKMIHVYVTLWF